MYQTFSIQNFRCFDDFTIGNLARVNLIAGKNNVGKTSLLQAIAIYGGNYRVISQEITSIRIGTRDDSGVISTQRNWLLLFNNLNPKNQIVLSTNAATITLALQSPEQIQDEYILRSIMNLHSDGKPLSANDILAIERDGYMTYLIKTDGNLFNHISHDKAKIPNVTFISAEQDLSLGSEIDWYSQLVRQNREETVLEAIQIVEPRLRKLTLLDDGLNAAIDGIREWLPITAMGGGVRHLLSIVLAMGAAQSGVLLVDDIDSGLHYSVLEDVWKTIIHAANLFDVQVFATTHRLEMIEAATQAQQHLEQAGDEVDLHLHRLDRHPETGQITAVTYDERLIKRAMELDIEVR